MNLLQVLESCVSKAKTAIHRSKHPATLAAVCAKGSNTQVAELKKSALFLEGDP